MSLRPDHKSPDLPGVPPLRAGFFPHGGEEQVSRVASLATLAQLLDPPESLPGQAFPWGTSCQGIPLPSRSQTTQVSKPMGEPEHSSVARSALTEVFFVVLRSGVPPH